MHGLGLQWAGDGGPSPDGSGTPRGRDLPYDAELKRRGPLVISEALETGRDERDPADAEQRIAHHRRSLR